MVLFLTKTRKIIRYNSNIIVLYWYQALDIQSHCCCHWLTGVVFYWCNSFAIAICYSYRCSSNVGLLIEIFVNQLQLKYLSINRNHRYFNELTKSTTVHDCWYGELELFAFLWHLPVSPSCRIIKRFARFVVQLTPAVAEASLQNAHWIGFRDENDLKK